MRSGSDADNLLGECQTTQAQQVSQPLFSSLHHSRIYSIGAGETKRACAEWLVRHTRSNLDFCPTTGFGYIKSARRMSTRSHKIHTVNALSDHFPDRGIFPREADVIKVDVTPERS